MSSSDNIEQTQNQRIFSPEFDNKELPNSEQDETTADDNIASNNEENSEANLRRSSRYRTKNKRLSSLSFQEDNTNSGKRRKEN